MVERTSPNRLCSPNVRRHTSVLTLQTSLCVKHLEELISIFEEKQKNNVLGSKVMQTSATQAMTRAVTRAGRDLQYIITYFPPRAHRNIPSFQLSVPIGIYIHFVSYHSCYLSRALIDLFRVFLTTAGL